MTAFDLDEMYQWDHDEYWRELERRDAALFGGIRQGPGLYCDSAADVKERAEEGFDGLIAENPSQTRYRTFGEFYNDWIHTNVRPSEPPAEPQQPCNSRVYNPMQRRHQPIARVVERRQRGREEFDAFKFITEQEETFKAHRLNVESQDSEFPESYEDQVHSLHQGDQALKKLARLVTILNKGGDYKVMETQSERRIN